MPESQVQPKGLHRQASAASNIPHRALRYSFHAPVDHRQYHCQPVQRHSNHRASMSDSSMPILSASLPSSFSPHTQILYQPQSTSFSALSSSSSSFSSPSSGSLANGESPRSEPPYESMADTDTGEYYNLSPATNDFELVYPDSAVYQHSPDVSNYATGYAPENPDLLNYQPMNMPVVWPTELKKQQYNLPQRFTGIDLSRSSHTLTEHSSHANNIPRTYHAGFQDLGGWEPQPRVKQEEQPIGIYSSTPTSLFYSRNISSDHAYYGNYVEDSGRQERYVHPASVSPDLAYVHITVPSQYPGSDLRPHIADVLKQPKEEEESDSDRDAEGDEDEGEDEIDDGDEYVLNGSSVSTARDFRARSAKSGTKRYNPYTSPSPASPTSRPRCSSTASATSAPSPPLIPHRTRHSSALPTPIPVPNLTKKSRGRRVPTVFGAEDDDFGRDESWRGGRTYTCTVADCGKCFARGEHLKRHVRSIHTHEKPHKCPYPGCGKDFSRHDNLGQHMRVHKNYPVPAPTDLNIDFERGLTVSSRSRRS